MRFIVFHKDHGITPAQWAFINGALTDLDPQGFFLQQLDIPAALGTVPCGLHGPAMGDAPVPRDEVEMVKRGAEGDPNRWLDPIVDRPLRPVSYVQVIGIRDSDDDGDHIKVFTCYGGPAAPQNPADPGNHDVHGATKFWNTHALTRPE